jgi:hypothetical protein
MTDRLYPELPCGKELFPLLLPWGISRQQYLRDEAYDFCTIAHRIDEAKQRLPSPSGRPAWTNYVAHALSLMTRMRLHLPPEEHDGIHYKPDHTRMRAYLEKHHPGWEDNLRPDPHAEFIEATRDLPRNTEAQRLEIQRIGQDIGNTGKTPGGGPYQGGCPRHRTSSGRGGTTSPPATLSRLPR